MAALRKERGLTQVQLADKLGITVKAVDYYERRAKNPSIEFVKRAASALGVRAVDLVDDGAPRKSSRGKPGPVSQLEDRLEKLRRLPKKQQEVVLKMLDGLLESTR